MKIDCRNLACPEPVLKTKKALDELPEDSILEVLVNSSASKENVLRYAQKNGFTCEEEEIDGDTCLTIVKGFNCTIDLEKKSPDFLNKVVFLTSDKVGENELGSMLVVGFMKSILELPVLPKTIICVNGAVKLTTAPMESDIIKAFKALEAKGVEIYSCGVCLDFYKVADELKVGMVGNAYGTIDMLLNSEGTITL
jgi:selenium metabolism protein YedF